MYLLTNVMHLSDEHKIPHYSYILNKTNFIFLFK